MNKELILLHGDIHSIHEVEQNYIPWFNNKMKIIKRIPIKEYSAKLNDQDIHFVLSDHYISSYNKVDVVAFREKDEDGFLVVALKHNQLLYLNPYLHDRAINPYDAFTIEFWHVLLMMIWGILHVFKQDWTLFGTLIGCFSVLGIVCMISGYFQLRKSFAERKAIRGQVLIFFKLPINLEDQIFSKKWRYCDVVGMVDLIRLNDKFLNPRN